MRGLGKTILDSIGRTPLVQLRRIGREEGFTIYGKLEAANPSGSVKDRAALAMVEDAEARGILKRGTTLVEPSSGNMGVALAMVGAAKGYRVIITLPGNIHPERQRLLTQYGAKLNLTPSDQGMKGAVQVANELAQDPQYVILDQFRNPANPKVHGETTAQEIRKQTRGTIHGFVAGVGTGGTITGVGKALKEREGSTLVVAVEPQDSPLLTRGRSGYHSIVGLGADFIPPILDRGVIDEVLDITDQEAMEMMHRLAREEGLLVGVSSGANVVAALAIARRLGPDKVVVTILPDTGERYLGLPA